MYQAFLIVALVLFILSAFVPFARTGPGWASPSLLSLGLAFFVAAFLVNAS